MGTLGDFVGGFQGGYDFMSKARRDRQIDKAIDYELSDWEREREGRNKEREAQGLEALKASGYKDPFLIRLMDKFGGGKQQAVNPAAPAQAPMQSQAPAASSAAPGGSFVGTQDFRQPRSEYDQVYGGQGQPTGPVMYRDGGPVDEETANRYELYRPVMMADGGYMLPGNQPGSRAIPPQPQPVVLADGGLPKRLLEEEKKQKKIEKQRQKTEAKGKKTAKPKRKGFGKGKIAKGVGALALGSTAIDVATTPTEDYYERFGMTPDAETNLGQFGQDLLVRTGGAAGDLASTLTGGYVDRFYRDKQRQTREALPTGGPAPQASAQAPAQAPAQGPSRVAAQPAPRQAPAQAPAPPPEQQGFDWSSVSVPPDEIPSVPVKDWVEYRKQMIDALTMQGRSVSEAHDEVTKIQQGGFLREAQSALMFMQGGDTASASRAMKAAYQYFPNGVDVKFGMTKDEQGQPALIAMGTDEESGENKGQPMLLNSERLSVMMQNFSDPKSFTAWTKDWRDEAFKDKKYEEIDKPEAQSQADLRSARIGYLEDRGLADILSATKGGALKQSDYDRAFKEFVNSQELRSLEDEATAEYLADIMARLYASDPSLPYPSITYKVMEAFRDGTLEEKLAQLEAQ